jgi:hypothetical protein
MRHTILLLTALVSALASPLAQAPRTAWFGVQPPPGLGDPHRAILDTSGLRPAPAVVPAGEAGHVELEGARIRRHLESIIGFSKADRAAENQMWGRVTGTPAAAATMQWVAQQFREAGLQGVEVQQFPATAAIWMPKSWRVQILGDTRFGAGTADVVLESAMPTSGSIITGGTLTAPLADAGSTAEAPTGDFTGKIAVQFIRPGRSAFSERGRTVDRGRELAKRGAVAVLNVIEQHGNMHVRDFSNAGVPSFNLGGGDGAFLRGIFDRARQANAADGLRARLTLDAQAHLNLSASNVVGTVPGRIDEVMIVNAHADGWFDAAGDNGDGLAVLIALARHFGKPENRLERTLVFVASAGHHGGGLNGPTNFVRMNPAITARTVMVLNLEHIAQYTFNPATWTVDAAEQSMGFGIDNASPALNEIGKRAQARYGFRLNPTFSTSVPGDLGGYAPIGVARVQAIHSGPMYHTSGDTLDTISTPGLERSARFYAYFLREASVTARAAINPPRAQ